MKDNSLLWKLNKEGGPTSYLFGTIHINNDLAFQHIHKAINALQTCDQFFAEINLDEAQVQLDPTTYLIPENGVISEYLTPKKFKKVRTIIKKSFAIDIAQYERLLPIMLTNKLSESLLGSKSGKTLDAALWAEAKRINLISQGLESLEEQLTLLQSLDINDQIKTLKSIARDTSKFRRTTKKLAVYYLEEDIYKLHKLSRKHLGKLRHSLLYNRNSIMSERIDRNMDKKSFFAIGAGHLAGNKGVLALLKRRNISLEGIK